MWRHPITRSGGSQRRQVLVALALALVLVACRRKPTYEQDIKPILATNCVECHRARGGAPPALETYEQVSLEAWRVKREVTTRNMPPWSVDNTGFCGTWQHARWLANEDVMTFMRWVDDGAPEGTARAAAASLPPAPPSVPFRRDVVADIGGEYHPDVGLGGNRCFVVDPKLDHDRFLAATKVTASDPRGIAQVTLYGIDSEAGERDVVAQDEAAPGLGFPCAGSLPTQDTRVVSSWTYGQTASRHFEGTGVRLRAGRKVVVQVHFNVLLSGRDYATTLEVALELEDRVKELEVVPIAVSGELPAGRARYDVTATRTFPTAVKVFGIVPHMHYGRVMQMQRLASGTTSCVAVFDHWKFGRQQVFLPTSPIEIGAGDLVRMSCAYRTAGWANPLPLGPKKGAEDEEECAAYLFVTPP